MFEPSQSQRRRAAAISSGLWLAWTCVACAPEVPPGRFSCESDSDCPRGWACAENARGEQRCFPTGSDGHAIRGDDRPRPEDTGSSEPVDVPDAAPEPDATAGSTEPPPPPPAAGSGGSKASPPAAGSGGAGAGAGGSTPPPPVAGSAPPLPPSDCEPPDPSKGVFAAPLDRGGISAADCGAADKPCSSVQRAMERAVAEKKKLVYLDSGKFVEPVVLLPELALKGAYVHDAGKWSRSCDAERASLTRIESPAEVGIWVEYDGASVLESLTIATLAKAPAGHSTYGVFARGIDTNLRLRDVRVLAAAGGNGARGAAGMTPPAREGSCGQPGNGANGATPGAPGAAAAAGMFDSSGYVPGDGAPGGMGVPGSNGAAGTSTCRNCVDSCPSTCDGIVVGQSCGFPGAPGCGGAPAAGGGGGEGGGSSIALYAWGARVQIDGGSLQAGDGGLGGAGGEPGQGGAGSDGAAGLNGETCTVCSKGGLIPIDPPEPSPNGSVGNLDVNAEVPADDVPAAGTGAIIRPLPDGGVGLPLCTSGKGYGVGTAGQRGGSGSAGGLGGSGSGGNSYGAYAGGEAILDISASTRIEIGKPGSSEGNGAPGDAKPLAGVN